MAARSFRFAGGTMPAALLSLILGIAALGVLGATLVLIDRDPLQSYISSPIPVTGAPVSQPVSILIPIGAGLAFLLGMVGVIAGFSAIPDLGGTYRTKACKWICGTGIGFSVLTAVFAMLVISFIRAFLGIP